MNSVNSFLKEIGMTDLEQEVFITCSKYPDSSISSLSRIIKRPRSTINDAIKKMVDEWFIIHKNIWRWNLHRSIWFDWLKALLESKKQVITKQIWWLHDMKNEFSKIKINDYTFTNLEYYKWINAINLIYNKLWQSKTLRAIYNPLKSIEYSNYSIIELSNNIIEHQIESREILTESSIWREYANHFKWLSRHKVKFISVSEMEEFHADHLIADDTFYFISFSNEIIWIEIKNPVFVNAQKVIFDQLRSRM